MTAGYSGTPLPQKLGIKEGMVVGIFQAPVGMDLGALPPGVELTSEEGRPVDLAICFATEAAQLSRLFEMATASLPPHGALWVAWPKKISKVPTDITEDRCRDLFLPTGMVDVKVCAIDGVWSGLKFVLRKELRPH